MDLLERIEECENKIDPKNITKKHAYRLLLEKLFRYQIAKKWFDFDLKKTKECPSCSYVHGLPDALLDVFSSIQQKLRIQIKYNLYESENEDALNNMGEVSNEGGVK